MAWKTSCDARKVNLIFASVIQVAGQRIKLSLQCKERNQAYFWVTNIGHAQFNIFSCLQLSTTTERGRDVLGQSNYPLQRVAESSVLRVVLLVFSRALTCYGFCLHFLVDPIGLNSRSLNLRRGWGSCDHEFPVFLFEGRKNEHLIASQRKVCNGTPQIPHPDMSLLWEIIAVLCATYTIVNLQKKNSGLNGPDSNPWPLWYQCSALMSS